MRAAIYARVSTERQERQQTITSQLAALQAWAEAAGHDLSERHVFRDEGYSGSRLDRPGLDALRDAVRDGEVDVVAVVSPIGWHVNMPIRLCCSKRYAALAVPLSSSTTPSVTILAINCCCRSRAPSPSMSVLC